ncbi:heme-binding protein 2 [Aplysia californica]|uniref:Heme-binding protein 2 n=1 Tax=Aplysia californica TaxID=6500 RepID=A0ABM0JBL4_APLCA|nr:heme-binding protein 2 [Aplysia californica]
MLVVKQWMSFLLKISMFFVTMKFATATSFSDLSIGGRGAVTNKLTRIGRPALTFVKNFQISEGKPQYSSTTRGKKPKFCNELDCPDYTVVSETDIYEERLYKESGWVSTKLMGIDFDAAQKKMFYRLFDYISGANVKKEKITMTAPVLDRIIPGQGPACENNFTMSFYMSTSVKDPPQPSDKTVYLSSLPEQRVFVKAFGGYASQSDWLKNAKELAMALLKDGKKFDKDYFYSAGYDSPFRILDRHNEVWYIAQE